MPGTGARAEPLMTRRRPVRQAGPYRASRGHKPYRCPRGPARGLQPAVSVWYADTEQGA